MSQDDKDRSHARIVTGASRLLRERGLGGASVSDVMGDAGMTQGGFYKHFASKDELVEQALNDAFAEFVAALQGGDADGSFRAYRARYLSREHMTHPGRGCPVAALGSDVARGPEALKAAFGRGVSRVIDAIAGSGKGSAAARRTAALREFSMLVGAMVIARASGPDLADEVMAACRSEARRGD